LRKQKNEQLKTKKARHERAFFAGLKTYSVPVSNWAAIRLRAENAVH